MDNLTPADSTSTNLELTSAVYNLTGVAIVAARSKLVVNTSALATLRKAGLAARALRLCAANLPTRRAIIEHLAELASEAEAERYIGAALDAYATAYGSLHLLTDPTFWGPRLAETAVAEANIVLEVFSDARGRNTSVLRLFGVAVPPTSVGSMVELVSMLQDGLVRDRTQTMAGFVRAGSEAGQRPTRIRATDWQAVLASSLDR